MPNRPLQQKLKELVGASGWIDDPQEISPWLRDSRGRFHGQCALFLQPGSTQEVAKIVSLCNKHQIGIVPQGGNTGRCAGATPDTSGEQVLLNLRRMNRIRDVDAANFSMTVEAGCILKNLQQEAASVDRYFPLSLGAEGSCQIGGNLSTNAGGINVLRYGNTRELVLGIEVVMPDGEIWNGLRALRKDNTGYDLKHLFIGAEGTLGIITAISLKLLPAIRIRNAAFCAIKNPDDALALLETTQQFAGDQVESFELIPDNAVCSALQHMTGIRFPLGQHYPWYILMELSSTIQETALDKQLENLLASALNATIIHDATIARSEQQRQAFWRLREAIVETQRYEGASIKHDVSVPLSRVPVFIEQANAAVASIHPGIRPFTFGHVGDGNIHYNLNQPMDISAKQFFDLEEELHSAVHDITMQLQGSFSAEHGIGQAKRMMMERYKDPVELAMMKQIKCALDPNNIMNPGKVL